MGGGPTTCRSLVGTESCVCQLCSCAGSVQSAHPQHINIGRSVMHMCGRLALKGFINKIEINGHIHFDTVKHVSMSALTRELRDRMTADRMIALSLHWRAELERDQELLTKRHSQLSIKQLGGSQLDSEVS